MKLSEVKSHLKTIDELVFQLPNGAFVPQHFHVTEVGVVEKKFIDCGGVVRSEKVVNFQLWEANDYNHRLGAQAMFKIIELSEKTLGLEDLDIEVEYQSETIGKYGLATFGDTFVLTSKFTDCLAPDKCGVPSEKPRIKLSDLNKNTGCTPGSGCC